MDCAFSVPMHLYSFAHDQSCEQLEALSGADCEANVCTHINVYIDICTYVSVYIVAVQERTMHCFSYTQWLVMEQTLR